MRWLIALIVVTLGFISPASVQANDIFSQMRDDRGLVVLLRHAIAPGGGDPAGFRLGDCNSQRQLSAQGREQARLIGNQYTSQGIPIAGVRSSRWCRAIDTARLLKLGKTRISAALDSVFTASQQAADRKKRQTERIIRDHRNKPGVLILVGHQANIIDLTGIALDSGGAVVVKADGSGRIRVIGQMAPPD